MVKLRTIGMLKIERDRRLVELGSVLSSPYGCTVDLERSLVSKQKS